MGGFVVVTSALAVRLIREFTLPPPNRSKFQHNRKEQRADHIYRVAAEIMCQKGFEATSMKDIAEAVGLPKLGFIITFPEKRSFFSRLWASPWTWWTRT